MRTLLHALTLFLSTAALAQTPLPYSTGFDNTAQQQGWQKFRKGHISSYDWSYTAVGAHSAPNQLWHDYNVGGSDVDTVKDWSVSPPFDLSDGGTLDLQAKVYSIMGSTMPADQLKVFLLVGSADPASAVVTELADLTGMVSSSDAWQAVNSITIPPTAGTSRIAFFYRSSQNWFTPGIDDVALVSSGNGVEEARNANVDIALYPNPVADELTIDVKDLRYAGQQLRLRVMDVRGARVIDRMVSTGTHVQMDLSNGRYVYAIEDLRGTLLKRGELVLKH